MITSNFTGNLGNHMWIYAITREVAERNNYDWGFNPTPEYDYYGGAPQMDFMDIDYGKTHPYKYHETPPWIEYEWQEEYIHMNYKNGDEVDYHPFQPDIFEVKDYTKLVIRCCQDARYLDKEKVSKWFKVKSGYKANVDFSEDLCIINMRGGEYKGVKNLILEKRYWQNAIAHMLDRNSKMRFTIITDDVPYANSLFPDIRAHHLGIGMDYDVINNAKNLILSNSSFAIFPAWLNENNPYVIAPRYWARNNISTGYWASSDIWTFGWNFLDRDGKLYDR